MAKVEYIGEYPEGDMISQYGYEFERGKTADVKDEAHLAKFEGNRFFAVSGQKDEEGQSEAEKAETETLKAWLDEERVPYRANASLKSLQDLKAKQEADKAKVAE